MNANQDVIVRDKAICGGQPVIRGTRVPLRTVLACLAEGATIEEIINDFPTLKEQDVRAVIAFAAASAEEDLPIPLAPHLAMTLKEEDRKTKRLIATIEEVLGQLSGIHPA